MAKSAIQTLATPQERALEASRQVALVVGASLFVALCARITIPLMPLTPVPLTVQNLGVLLVGLLLGSRRGFAALALYLVEGAVGLAGVQSGPGPGRNRTIAWAYRRISDGLSVRRFPRGIYF